MEVQKAYWHPSQMELRHQPVRGSALLKKVRDGQNQIRRHSSCNRRALELMAPAHGETGILEIFRLLLLTKDILGLASQQLQLGFGHKVTQSGLVAGRKYRIICI